MGHYSAVDAVLDKPSEDTRAHARIIDALVPENQTITVWQGLDPVLAFYIKASLHYIEDISWITPQVHYLLTEVSYLKQEELEKSVQSHTITCVYGFQLPKGKGHYVLYRKAL
jgi:hypothetical protein